MSDEAQRMTALKSAYADIILNTTKESATRILASERRTLRLQQNLSMVKEESLAMLLRLKAIMEGKITESEKENLSRARKIEELEVQLREANVMINHLKSEIRRLNFELDHKRDIEAKYLDGKQPRSNASCMKYNIQEDIDNSDSYLHFPNEHEIIKNSSRCFTKDVMRHEPMRNLARSNHFGGNLDLASMTQNNKMQEFYQNGCSHRAQTFKLVHDQKSNPTTTCVNKKAERAFPQKFATTIKRLRRRSTRQRKFIAWPTNSDTLHDMQHCGLLESSYSMVRESDIDKDMNRNGSMAFPKWSAQVSGEDQESIQNQKSNLNTSSFRENNLGLSDGNGVMKSGTILKACNSTSENHIARSYTSSRITCQQNGQKEPLIMSTSVVIDDDGKTGITTEEEMSVKSYCKVAKDLGTPVTKEIQKTTNAPLDDHKDEPCRSTEPDAVVGGPKLLKYTFQRKRKRGSMDTKAEFKSMEEHVPKKKAHKGNEENMSPINVVKDNEENVSTRKLESDNVLVENQKSSMVVESSRDSRRMAQVARQLISLSERRRW
ncbi:uncharacterized protein LOC141836564 [Curcuma longa]|uniref:uncharacterized protein LOC141836564 n=1 Tax=Curcuma longa TaxID=136217 RepID=UPI003D9ED6AB